MKFLTLLQRFSKLTNLLCSLKIWSMVSYNSLSYIRKPKNCTSCSFHHLSEALFMKLLALFQRFSKLTDLLCLPKSWLMASYKSLSYIKKYYNFTSCSFHHPSEALFMKLLTLFQSFSRLSYLLYAPKNLLISNFTPSSHSYSFFSIFLS